MTNSFLRRTKVRTSTVASKKLSTTTHIAIRIITLMLVTVGFASLTQSLFGSHNDSTVASHRTLPSHTQDVESAPTRSFDQDTEFTDFSLETEGMRTADATAYAENDSTETPVAESRTSTQTSAPSPSAQNNTPLSETQGSNTERALSINNVAISLLAVQSTMFQTNHAHAAPRDSETRVTRGNSSRVRGGERSSIDLSGSIANVRTDSEDETYIEEEEAAVELDVFQEDEQAENESIEEYPESHSEDSITDEARYAAAAPTRSLARAASPSLASSIQAWIYPGNPACNAHAEFKDGRSIRVLKPEYFTVADSGALTLLTVATHGCNAFSAANAAEVRQYSAEQYVTISSNASRMSALVTSPGRRQQAIDTLTRFVSEHQFTGVELDFEGYSHWSQADYDGFKIFVRDLGTALHADAKKLQVDAPPIGTEREQGYYLLTYSDLAELPIDQIVIMAYDYMYDHGSGTPIAPTDWVTTIVNRAKREIGDLDRIVIGIPSYGYQGATETYEPTLLTYAQMSGLPGFGSASRDPGSHERIWNQGSQSYIINDTHSMDAKRDHIQSLGIRHVSVWHLGGNQWFSR
jgi:hypothetical protein